MKRTSLINYEACEVRREELGTLYDSSSCVVDVITRHENARARFVWYANITFRPSLQTCRSGSTESMRTNSREATRCEQVKSIRVRKFSLAMLVLEDF